MTDEPAITDFPLPERRGPSAAHNLVAAGRELDPGASLRIEASEVERMSCAIVLALVSVAQAAADTGGAVIIRAPTNAFTDAFADLGMFESLMKMEFA